MNINHTIIAGNLTRDPECKNIGADKQVAAFTVAVSRKFKTAAGETKEDVAFIDCEAWGPLAGTISGHFAKGKGIVVQGRIKQENWEDKESGAKRSKLKLVVTEFSFVPDGKQRGDVTQQERQVDVAPRAAVRAVVRADDDDSSPPF